MAVVICVLFIFFIIWIGCIPSGKLFLRQNIRDYRKLVAAEHKVIAFGQSAVANSNSIMLMEDFRTLSTFVEVEEWDEKADLEIKNLASQIQQLDREITQFKEILLHSKLLKVLFESKLKQFNCKYKIPLENEANKLQEAIDFTPNSLNEKQELLKELKTQKKALQLQKREVSADMKAIRRNARTKSANAGRRLLGYDSKIAARERRRIRYRKEAKLCLHEDAMTAIERQLLQIDKDIFWVESFKN